MHVLTLHHHCQSTNPFWKYWPWGLQLHMSEGACVSVSVINMFVFHPFVISSAFSSSSVSHVFDFDFISYYFRFSNQIKININSTKLIWLWGLLLNRAEHGAGANAGGRSAGGKLSIRRRRKGPRAEWVEPQIQNKNFETAQCFSLSPEIFVIIFSF